MILVFDLDGTIVDSIGIILKNFQLSFQYAQEKYPGDDKIRPEIGRGVKEIFSKFFPPEKITLAEKFFIENGNKIYLNSVQIFPEVFQILSNLKNKNYKLAIATSKLRKLAMPILEKFNIDHFFEIIIGSEDVKNCKPSPEPLEKIANFFNAKKSEIIFIGDSKIDGMSAKNAGITFFGVATGAEKFSELEKYGETFPSLKTLVQAKF